MLGAVMAEREQWHLDKKVPIALIIALAVQTFTFGWWAATQDARILSLERDNGRLEKRVEAQDAAGRDAAGRLIRVEEKASSILELVREIAQRSKRND